MTIDSESMNCGSSPHPQASLGSSSGRTSGFEPEKHSSNLCPRTNVFSPRTIMEGIMSFQKCPVCNGVGIVSGGYFTRAGDCNYWIANSATESCKTCKSTGLIDEITGLPPAIKSEISMGEPLKEI